MCEIEEYVLLGYRGVGKIVKGITNVTVISKDTESDAENKITHKDALIKILEESIVLDSGFISEINETKYKKIEEKQLEEEISSVSVSVISCISTAFVILAIILTAFAIIYYRYITFA